MGKISDEPSNITLLRIMPCVVRERKSTRYVRNTSDTYQWLDMVYIISMTLSLFNLIYFSCYHFLLQN